MSETEAGAAEAPANGKPAMRRTGATLFSELVRAHYRCEAAEEGGADGGKARAEFEAKLSNFEQEVGQIDCVYWSSRRPSAVALTIGTPHGVRNPFKDTETDARLHRVTDWVTGDRSEIADLLHDCDLLAIRVGEVLRGASERITMRWIFSVQEHLLGFFERVDYGSPRRRWWTPNGKKGDSHLDREERRLVAAQRQELARIEEYYLRIAGKAGRIVYVTGMIVGTVFIALLCALVAIVLAVFYPEGWTANERLVLLCAGAGAAGALTSVLARMNSIGGSFTIDVELGRPLLRRLGLYKPFVGAIFGVAVYWIFAGGLLAKTQIPNEAHNNNRIFFFGIVAFLAGFSERFTGVIFGGAERLLSGDHGDADASDSRGKADARATTPAELPAEARTPRPASPRS